MADEHPKRVRGQKEREAAYRQGFRDGVEYGVEELRRAREAEADREVACGAGLAKFRRVIATEPKRRRKVRANGPTPNDDAARATADDLAHGRES